MHKKGTQCDWICVKSTRVRVLPVGALRANKFAANYAAVGVGGVVCSTVTGQYGIRFNGSVGDSAAVVVLETFHSICFEVDVWFAHVLLCVGIYILYRI